MVLLCHRKIFERTPRCKCRRLYAASRAIYYTHQINRYITSPLIIVIIVSFRRPNDTTQADSRKTDSISRLSPTSSWSRFLFSLESVRVCLLFFIDPFDFQVNSCFSFKSRANKQNKKAKFKNSKYPNGQN